MEMSAARPRQQHTWRVPALRSVKLKFLLPFGVFVVILTLLNAGLSAYLTRRQGESEARQLLSQHLLLLQDHVLHARDALRAAARGVGTDPKTLSDFAIVYTQELSLDRLPDPLRERTARLQKAVSLNRLHLVLDSARLASLAVYLDGELSHYVTPTVAGMRVREGEQRVLRQRPLPGPASFDLDDPSTWSSHPPPVTVAPRLPVPDGMTAAFEFPADDTLLLRVAMPIRAVVREAFNETIAEQLEVAGPEPPANPEARVIGMFVLGQAFDRGFLEGLAHTTGVLPALMAPDGRRRLELIDMQAPVPLAGLLGRHVQLRATELDGTSYYQSFLLLRDEGMPPLLLGGALSRDRTSESVRQMLAGVLAAAALVLAIGLGVGYLLVSRTVAPIKALTAAAASMEVEAGAGADGPAINRALFTALGRYLDQPLPARSVDEIGALTTTFNALAARLHTAIQTLSESHRALEQVSAERSRAEEEVRALNASLEQQVRERTAQLEAANRELESFSYSVSHDLRAPLRALDGFSRALLEDYDGVLDDEGRDFLKRIRAGSQHMGMLIDALLDLARVSRGELRREPVDLTALARTVVERLGAARSSPPVEFAIAEGLRTTGDPRLLQIVLENLLNNACKFSGRRAHPRVEVGATPHGDGQAFFVRDNGVGFDMAFAHKLFGAFQRLHTSEEFPGTGIGLATVQRIVHRHGGTVWVESQVDRGATFSFTLGDTAARPA